MDSSFWGFTCYIYTNTKYEIMSNFASIVAICKYSSEIFIREADGGGEKGVGGAVGAVGGGAEAF